MRYLRALCYLLIGQIGTARDTLSGNPRVIAASYDDVLRSHGERMHRYMQGIATLITERERKKQSIKRLKRDLDAWTTVRDNALKRARVRLKELDRDPNAATADSEFTKLQEIYTEAAGHIGELHSRIQQRQEYIEEFNARITEFKGYLTEMTREYQQVRAESAESVAMALSARDERALNDMLAGFNSAPSATETVEDDDQVVDLPTPQPTSTSQDHIQELLDGSGILTITCEYCSTPQFVVPGPTSSTITCQSCGAPLPIAQMA